MTTNLTLNLDKRLQRLEEALVGDPVVILVRDPEGQEVEMTVQEFDARRKSEGFAFVRILRGFDPTYHDVDVILDSWDCVAALDRNLREEKNNENTIEPRTPDCIT